MIYHGYLFLNFKCFGIGILLRRMAYISIIMNDYFRVGIVGGQVELELEPTLLL